MLCGVGDNLLIELDRFSCVKRKVSSLGSGIILVLEVPFFPDDEDDDDNACVESIAFPLESGGVLGEPSIGYLKYAILME
jgi:hypothetical protein